MPAGRARESGQGPSGVRLAEVVAALSRAVDLGLGQPMEHVARSCLVACRLGEHTGISEAERASLYYVSLLGWVGCIADSREVATSFGDDLTYRAGVYDVDLKPVPFLGYLLRRAGGGAGPARKALVGAGVLATGAAAVQESLRAHCQVTSHIASQLGLGPEVSEPLTQIFARWDGKGLPAKLGGADIPLQVRLWHIADVAEVHHRRGGVEAAVAVARDRSGTQFDPALVSAFEEVAPDIFGELAGGSTWDDLVAEEPALRPPMTEAGLDGALGVMSDFADLKSPYYRGHSRGVAQLAGSAARVLGLSEPEQRLVRRAGLVHDLGRAGVPNTVWDKAGPLSDSELERARLVPYYTERMLSRPAPLAEIGAVAALTHERLDGSGYHRSLPSAAIPRTARILAAADRYHSLREARPHRGPLTGADAAERVLGEVRAGRLDAAAVDAVLVAAGERRRHAAGPAGLTSREVEVLVLLARGASNRQIAHALTISPKTVGNHVERVYAKAGVSTRAAATLFALGHGLLGRLDPLE